VLLPRFPGLREYLNADEIAREISPENVDAAALAAGRRLLERMRELVREGESFALETTCAGKTYIPALKECVGTGWRVSLFYLWLPSPEASIARVSKRVSEGGHSIPTEAIYRRFRTGLWNMIHLYLPLADTAAIYDNSGQERALVAEKESGFPVRVFDQERWLRMEEISQWK
jgi:predicted ABC-type ATPase